MEGMVRVAARLRPLVVLATGATLVGGLVLLRDAPVDPLPELSPPYVEIQTEALGLSASEVEELITVPLEANMLAGVAWVESISSQSVPGLSSIVLTFEPGTDILRARQVVQERLTQAHALPRVSRPPTMLQPLSSRGRVMMIGLSSDELSLIDLSVLTRWSIRPRLMGVEGVANVAVWGQRERQLQVQVDPSRLHDGGVTLDQVVRTTGNALWYSPLSYLNASTPGAGGFIETENQRLGVRHVQPIRTPEDLAAVRIEGSDQRLGDVAEVVEHHQPLIGEVNTRRGGGLLLIVERFPGADVRAVTDGIEEALAALGPGLDGVEVDTSIFRAATFVDLAIENVGIATGLGLLIVGLTLTFLGYRWRSATLALLIVIVSAILGLVAIRLVGGTIDGMGVAGVLGATAVALAETTWAIGRVARRIDERRAGTADARARTAADVVVAEAPRSTYRLLMALLAVVPVLVIGGLTGALLAPFALAFAGTLVVSWVVRILVTAAFSAVLLRGRGGSRATDRTSLTARIASTADRVAPSARVAAIAVILLVVLVGGLVPFLRADPLPAFAERDLVVTLNGPPGASTAASSEIVDRVRADLQEVAGVREVVGQVGRAVLSDRVSNVDTAQLWVSLEPYAPYGATVADVEAALDAYADLGPTVETYHALETAALAPPPDDQVTVRVFGPSIASLEEQAAAVRDAVADVDGVGSVDVEPIARAPEVEVEVDVEAAGRHGLKPGDIRRAASALISGIEVGSLFEDQKVFEVVVWGVPSLRESVEDLGTLLIDTPAGEQVPLADVASIRVAETESLINREGISRRLDVIATVDGDPAAVTEAIANRVAELRFPLEYHAEVDTSLAEIQADRDRAVLWGLAATVGVFLLLQAAFSSWRIAALALVVPVAALGGATLAAAVTGGTVSVGAIAGTVIAVIVATAVAFRILDGRRASAPWRRGTARRAPSAASDSIDAIRSTAAIVALLVPFAVMGHVPGLEIAQPLAVTALSGIVLSTVVSLVILPPLVTAPPAEAASSLQAVTIQPTADREPVATG